MAVITRFWFVRHGPTHERRLTGWRDVPADLSDRAAVARLAAALPAEALVVSSDLIRAVATADAIAAGRRRLAHDAGLRELHFGDWDGQDWATIAARDPDLSRAYWDDPGPHAPPGGESWDGAAARVGAAVDRLVAAHRGADLVVVAHFGAILTQVQRARACTAAQVIAQPIDNLSITRLDHGPDGWRVRSVNQTP